MCNKKEYCRIHPRQNILLLFKVAPSRYIQTIIKIKKKLIDYQLTNYFTTCNSGGN